MGFPIDISVNYKVAWKDFLAAQEAAQTACESFASVRVPELEYYEDALERAAYYRLLAAYMREYGDRHMTVDEANTALDSVLDLLGSAGMRVNRA